MGRGLLQAVGVAAVVAALPLRLPSSDEGTAWPSEAKELAGAEKAKDRAGAKDWAAGSEPSVVKTTEAVIGRYASTVVGEKR